MNENINYADIEQFAIMTDEVRELVGLFLADGITFGDISDISPNQARVDLYDVHSHTILLFCAIDKLSNISKGLQELNKIST